MLYSSCGRRTVSSTIIPHAGDVDRILRQFQIQGGSIARIVAVAWRISRLMCDEWRDQSTQVSVNAGKAPSTVLSIIAAASLSHRIPSDLGRHLHEIYVNAFAPGVMLICQTRFPSSMISKNRYMRICPNPTLATKQVRGIAEKTFNEVSRKIIDSGRFTGRPERRLVPRSLSNTGLVGTFNP